MPLCQRYTLADCTNFKPRCSRERTGEGRDEVKKQTARMLWIAPRSNKVRRKTSYMRYEGVLGLGAMLEKHPRPHIAHMKFP